MIEIDPNVRTHHNHTFTYLDTPEERADLDGIMVGDAIVVIEPEAGLMWPATLVEVREDGYVQLDVSWSKGKPLPPEHRAAPEQ